MFGVHAIGPKVRGFKPGRGDRLLCSTKTRSSTFLRGELKPKSPCRNILRHVKELYE
jgi:hypothetical protein